MTAIFIVTPVRNAIRTIDATIWSIVSQEGGLDIHYHVQDGASDDGTLAIIESWAERLQQMSDSLPSRVHFSFASKPDRGMYEAIATAFSGMEIPPDAFMGWCNADDALWPGAFETITRVGNDIPDTDWVIGWPTWFDDLGRVVAIVSMPRYPQYIVAAGLADGIHWSFVQQESTFWRKRLWDKVGGLDTSLRLAGDWDLWVRFAQSTPLVHVHRQLGGFHVRPGQQSADIDSYRVEMNLKFPVRIRKSSLKKQLQKKFTVTSVVVAFQDASCRWKIERRACSKYAKLLFVFISMFNISSSWVLKHIFNKW